MTMQHDELQVQIKAELLNCLKDEQKHSTLKKVQFQRSVHHFAT